MMTLRNLFDGSSDPKYRAAVAQVAKWCGWEAPVTREIMETIERLNIEQ